MVNNIEGSSCLKQAKTQSHTWQVGCWLIVIVYIMLYYYIMLTLSCIHFDNLALLQIQYYKYPIPSELLVCRVEDANTYYTNTNHTNTNSRGSRSLCAGWKMPRSTFSSPSAFSSSSVSSSAAHASFVFGMIRIFFCNVKDWEYEMKMNGKKWMYSVKKRTWYISGGLLHSEKKNFSYATTRQTLDYHQCSPLPLNNDQKIRDLGNKRLLIFIKYW